MTPFPGQIEIGFGALKAPNLSDRVTSEVCDGCGKCCEAFEIYYLPPDGSIEMAIYRSEMQRFMMLSGIGDNITTREAEDGGTWLVFNYPCKFLTHDKRCEIYDSPNRPFLCRCFPYPNSTSEDCPKLNDDIKEVDGNEI